MSVRIGVAVGSDTIRAVAVRGRAVVWAAETIRDHDEPLRPAIDSLVATAPAGRWRRPVLSVAVGAHASQVRLVSGLPELDDPETLAAVIRESPGSFFLKNGVPLVTSGVRIKGAGKALAAAVDQPVIEAAGEVCRSRRWRLGAVAPAPVALPLAVKGVVAAWRDGPVIWHVASADGVVDSVRAQLAHADMAAEAAAEPVAELGALGEEALGFAAAYGAALLPEAEPLALRPRVTQASTIRDWARQLIWPGSVCGVALAAILLSPLAASWSGARAERRVAAIEADQWEDVTAALAQLDRVSAMLQDLGAFAASRRSMTEVLGNLARALPDGSVLVQLDVGAEGGQLQVLTPRPDAVLAAVDTLRWIASADLVGPSIREATAGRVLERIVVRLQFAGEDGR